MELLALHIPGIPDYIGFICSVILEYAVFGQDKTLDQRGDLERMEQLL
jgi:hypothetical protein